MAYNPKYEIKFYSKEGDFCKVQMSFDGYAGAVIQLNGAARPFILREFNTDDDIYKPLRPQQAEINFISQNGVSIDDFLGNNDIFCLVKFYYGGELGNNVYWSGYLLQDEFQEFWEDTSHIITLRASENLGSLKTIPLADNNNNEIVNNEYITQYIRYCVKDLVQVGSSKYQTLWVLNNLFNTYMDDTSPSLDQVYVDPKTFSIGDGEYLDEYTVLERINRAFSQTIFQYNNAWYVVRVEENYIPNTDDLRIFEYKFLQFPVPWNIYNKRFDVNVGVNELVKPIAPAMLRLIKRPTKIDQINITYDYPSELLCNENFKRGTLLTTTSTLKTYSINDWNAYKGLRETPTAISAAYYRKDKIDTFGNVFDSYAFLPWESTGTATGADWLQSCDIQVTKGDVIDISFLWRWNESGTLAAPTPTFNVAQILFKADASPQFRAGMDTEGVWKIAPSTWDSYSVANIPYIKFTPPETATSENGYFQISALSKPIPATGIIRVLLHNTSNLTYNGNFSQLQLRLQASLNGLTTSNIDGDFDRFTKAQDIRSNFYDDIYLADMPNPKFMGTLFDDNGVKTDPTWYRYRYNAEEISFKKQNLIAQWEQNRFYRNKIDANFFGLKWLDGEDEKLIGLINTVKFVDDDPNKVYLIANLKEIDFANSTWSATLQEVYDMDRDFENETDYPTYLKDYIYK